MLRDRRFVPVFGLALAAMLYTHNWALFFAAAGVGIVVALIWRETEERRGLIRDGLIGFGIAGLAYALAADARLPVAAHRRALVERAGHLRANAPAVARPGRLRAGDGAGVRGRPGHRRGMAAP